MIGENTVEFNHSQMTKAMETYLKEHEFKNTNFEVTKVEMQKGEAKRNESTKDKFIIHLKETEETKVQTINQ